MSQYIESTMVWRGISMTVRYNSCYFKSPYKTSDFSIAHLEVITDNKAPLPFTESGYRSHFTDASEIEEYDTPIDFVKAWLAVTAKSKHWKKNHGQHNQLTLF